MRNRSEHQAQREIQRGLRPLPPGRSRRERARRWRALAIIAMAVVVIAALYFTQAPECHAAGPTPRYCVD